MISKHTPWKVWRQLCEDLRTCRTTQGVFAGMCIFMCVSVYVCVSDRRDQVQLCLVFISATQRKLEDEGGIETRSGREGKGSRGKTNTSKYMPVFSPSGDQEISHTTKTNTHMSMWCCRNIHFIYTAVNCWFPFLLCLIPYVPLLVRKSSCYCHNARYESLLTYKLIFLLCLSTLHTPDSVVLVQ